MQTKLEKELIVYCESLEKEARNRIFASEEAEDSNEKRWLKASGLIYFNFTRKIRRLVDKKKLKKTFESESSINRMKYYIYHKLGICPT